MWATTAISFEGFKQLVTVGSGSSQKTTQCAAVLTNIDPRARVLLQLADGGKIAMASPNSKYSIDMQGGCGGTCEGLQLAGKCKLSFDCNVCSCNFDYLLAGSGSWSREDAIMTWAIGSQAIPISYCVQGDQMALRDLSGVTLTLERVTLRGKPFPCAERGVEGCTGSCAAGACVGSAKCANAKSAEACSATSGCAWDDQACGGTATSTCTLTDYGATPGCEILSGKTECVGTPTACEQLSESNCWFNAGCKSGGHCTGGAQSCQQFEGTCAACSLHSGCKCDGAKTCQGTTTCEGHPLSDCDDINGCTWRECAGEPLPCSQFSELQCPNVPGCHVEGP